MASIVNSATTRTLTSGEIWNNSAPMEDIKSHASAVVSIHTDQPSATNGIECRWSIDKVNWDFYDRFTISGDDPMTETSEDSSLTKTINVEHRARYFGVKYTNGPNTSNSFRLQTVHKAMPQSLAIENLVSTTVSGMIFADNRLLTEVSGSVTVLNPSSGTATDVSVTNAVTISGTNFADNRLLTEVSGSVTVLNPSSGTATDVSVTNAVTISGTNFADNRLLTEVSGSVTVLNPSSGTATDVSVTNAVTISGTNFADNRLLTEVSGSVTVLNPSSGTATDVSVTNAVTISGTMFADNRLLVDNYRLYYVDPSMTDVSVLDPSYALFLPGPINDLQSEEVVLTLYDVSAYEATEVICTTNVEDGEFAVVWTDTSTWSTTGTTDTDDFLVAYLGKGSQYATHTPRGNLKSYMFNYSVNNPRRYMGVISSRNATDTSMYYSIQTRFYNRALEPRVDFRRDPDYGSLYVSWDPSMSYLQNGAVKVVQSGTWTIETTAATDVSVTNAVTISGYNFADNRLLTDISGSVTIVNPITDVSITNSVTVSGYNFSDNRLQTDISGSVTVVNPITDVSVTNSVTISGYNFYDSKLQVQSYGTHVSDPSLDFSGQIPADTFLMIPGPISVSFSTFNGIVPLYDTSGYERTVIDIVLNDPNFSPDGNSNLIFVHWSDTTPLDGIYSSDDILRIYLTDKKYRVHTDNRSFGAYYYRYSSNNPRRYMGVYIYQEGPSSFNYMSIDTKLYHTTEYEPNILKDSNGYIYVAQDPSLQTSGVDVDGNTRAILTDNSGRLLVQTSGVDLDGNNRSIITDTSGYVITNTNNDYNLDVARYAVPRRQRWSMNGYTTYVTNVHKPIWNSSNVISDTALANSDAPTFTISMASASDRNNGIGARSIIVTGLNDQCNSIQEVISLTDASVDTTLSYLRINNLTVNEVGQYYGNNKGLIEARDSTGNLAALINVEESESKQLVYSVPADKMLYITDMTFNSVTNVDSSLSDGLSPITYPSEPNINVNVRTAIDNSEFYRPVRVVYRTSGNVSVNLKQYIEVPAKSDLFVTAGYTHSSYTGNLFTVHGILTGYLVDYNDGDFDMETGYRIVDEDYVT